MQFPLVAAFLIPVLSVQLPAQASGQGSGPLFQHQEAYPHETIAVFGINAVGPHEAELKQTGLFRLFENSPELAQALPQMIEQISARTGLDQMELEALAKGGMSIALTGYRAPDHFDFMGLVELGASSAKLEGMLSIMGEPLGTIAGTQVYSIAIPPEMRLSYCVHESTLMFASSREQVEAGLERLSDKAKPSLASSSKFRRTASQLSSGDASQPLVAGYLDFTKVVDALLEAVPAESKKSVDQVFQVLNLRQATALGYSAMPGSGRITDHFRVFLESEPQGILAALAPKVGRLDPEFNRFVPLGVSSFALTHLSFDELFSQSLIALGSYDNNIASQARMALRQMTTQTGVDIERDLIGSLGQRVLTLQWPSAQGQSPDFALLIELRSEVRFDGALRKLSMLKHSTWQDFQVYNAELPGMAGASEFPGLAVGKRFLTIASTRPRLESMLKHLSNPQANVRVKTLFSNQPSGTIASGWSNLRVMFEGYSGLFDRLEQVAERSDLERFRRTFEGLAKLLGESETSVIRDESGLSFIARSPTGALGGLIAAGISAASTGLGSSVAIDAGDSFEDRAEFESFRQLLTEIAISELAHKEQVAGSFVDLQTLVDSGSMERSLLGKAKGDGVFDQGSHLIRVLLPSDQSERDEQFIVVAWPNESGTGNVYACRRDGLPLINTLITGSTGVETIQTRDVFQGGSFAGNLTPGWRRLETRELSAVRNTNTADSAQDWELYQDIIKAEESGEGDATKLIPLLESENVDLASRAAFALGKLQMSEAVPDLIKIVGTHSHIEVRRFAMSALKDLRDPRSIQASSVALTSSDLKLRSLAASNLGRLRKEEGVDPLLGLLANSPENSGSTDRVQAILALCDIGSHRSLLPAASSVHAGSEPEEEALTYMFQVLTPKLQPEEELTTLLAVLDHESMLLRRYAIQRLGELKDNSAIPALEERLAVEGPELKPLLDVALHSMIEKSAESSSSNTSLALLKFRQWKQQAIDYWHNLDQAGRNKLVAGSAGGFILFLTLIFLGRRRRRRKRANNWVSAMVAPSEEEFVQQPEDYEESYEENYEETYEESIGQEQGSAEQQGLVGLPPGAEIPTGEGWEHAELGVGPGDDSGLDEDGFER